MVECLAGLCAAVAKRRYVAGADLAKGFTTAKRPHGMWKYMHMLQGFKRNDIDGTPLVYGLPMN